MGVFKMKMTFNILNQSCCKSDPMLPIAIIGAGPVGLAAAAHLTARNIPFILLEKGNEVGANIKTWGHVKLFSPWKYNMDLVAKNLLLQTDWQLPNEEIIPTGQEMIDQYLKPLSDLDQIKPSLYINHQVISISRKLNDKLKSKNRNTQPFIIYVESDGRLKTFEARAVLDATGTWGNPNPAQGNGVWLPLEKSLKEHIDYHIPNCHANPTVYANKKIAVIGGGHSAINSLLNLVKLKKEAPSTEITWILRKENIELAYGGEQNDELAERGALGSKIRQLVEDEIIKVITPFFITSINDGEKISIIGTSRNEEIILEGFDRLIVNTGSRPDFSMNSELRLSIDSTTESVTALAPLIDPNVHSCGTVRPHGELELRQPEESFYVVGGKSYGRAPTFLMATGYEQVRSITSYLAGDLESAKRVELNLPETGVCNSRINECC